MSPFLFFNFYFRGFTFFVFLFKVFYLFFFFFMFSLLSVTVPRVRALFLHRHILWHARNYATYKNSTYFADLYLPCPLKSSIISKKNVVLYVEMSPASEHVGEHMVWIYGFRNSFLVVFQKHDWLKVGLFGHFRASSPVLFLPL